MGRLTAGFLLPPVPIPVGRELLLVVPRLGHDLEVAGARLALQALAIALYLVARDLDTLYAVSMLFGLSYGGAMPLYAILVRENFPAKIMGSVFGIVAMIAALGMALGPPAGGWLFDRFGGYGWLYIASSAIGITAALMAMTLRSRGRRPAMLAAAV